MRHPPHTAHSECGGHGPSQPESYAVPCDFCDEFAGRPTRFTQLYGERSRLLYADDTFVVFPTLGQIGLLYLLIAPRRHIWCMAHLLPDEIVRLENLLGRLCERLAPFGQVVGFEHGATGPVGGSNSVSHAHFHLLAVPAAIDMRRFFDPADPVCGAPTLGACYRRLADAQQYLLSCDPAGGIRYLDTTALAGKYPSQFFRRALAAYLGTAGTWDWRACGVEPELLDTLRRFSGGIL